MFGNDLALFGWLILINLFCFSRTLTGYFLADDFVHVPYLYQVFHGHPNLLIENFYSNWMQAQGTQFYRPLISITLAIDYLIWGVNAVGYHITNFIYQCAATIFLFLSVRRLFEWNGSHSDAGAGASKPAQARWIAFVAAALFAANPLHAEVVSWIIARVDSVACAFLLASFWLYLRARATTMGASGAGANAPEGRSMTSILSYLAFALALLSKEMAITLPPTLVLLEFLKAEKTSWFSRTVRAFKVTWIYWAIFIVYMIVRTLSLGTVAGGYAGSIGYGLSDSIVKRWFQDGSLGRVFFPLNSYLPTSANKLRRILRILYEVLAVLFVFRMILFARIKPLRVGSYLLALLFSVGWFVLCLAPTYQVWNLTESLQGSRFIYLGTAPLALFFALLLAPLLPPESVSKKDTRAVQIFNGVTAVLALFFVTTFAQIAQADNMQWGRASAGLRGFKKAIEAELNSLPESSTMVVLNIPQRFEGAHMLYNAATMSVLLSPPLASKSYASRVATFEPIEFGDADLISAARLQRYLKENAGTDRFRFYQWIPQELKLKPLHLVASSAEMSLPGPNFAYEQGADQCLVSPPIKLPSTATAFVDVKLSGKAKETEGPNSILTLSWNTIHNPIFESSRALNLAVTSQPEQICRFNVGQRKSWVMSETIYQLRLKVPAGLTVTSVDLKNGEDEIAQLFPDPSKQNGAGGIMQEDLNGVCHPGAAVGLFSYDVSKIKGADHALLEISQRDSWFEHYTGQYNDSERSEHAGISQPLNGVQGADRSIAASVIGSAGFYELRVAALSKDKEVVGCFSDPINIQLSGLDVRSASGKPTKTPSASEVPK